MEDKSASCAADTRCTALGPVALPGGLLIITGGEGGSGAKLEADHVMGFTGGGGGGGGGGAWFTGDGGREILFIGRGTVA